MSLAMPRPRITASMLPDFIGSTVCLAGQIIEVDQAASQWVKLQTSEGLELQCTVVMGDEFELTEGFVEVLGTVEDKTSMNLQFYASLGNEFDLNLYDDAVKITAQYPDIFPQRPV